MSNNKIYRSLESVVTPSEGRKISGTAIVFESWSNDLGGFREIIRRGALTQDIINNSDVMACMDHDPSYVMARSKNGVGNLRLTLTENGLDFEFDAPETAKGEELLQHIKRGEYTSCSFCFTLPSGGDNWFNENGEVRREITKFDRIWDISIVYSPAYDATHVDARSIENAKIITKINNLENDINNIYVE